MRENYNTLQEVLNNLWIDLLPLHRIEYLTGFIGYGLVIHGAVKSNSREIITGLIFSGLSGLYGAYKDGCFSKKSNTG